MKSKLTFLLMFSLIICLNTCNTNIHIKDVIRPFFDRIEPLITEAEKHKDCKEYPILMTEICTNNYKSENCLSYTSVSESGRTRIEIERPLTLLEDELNNLNMVTECLSVGYYVEHLSDKDIYYDLRELENSYKLIVVIHEK